MRNKSCFYHLHSKCKCPPSRILAHNKLEKLGHITSFLLQQKLFWVIKIFVKTLVFVVDGDQPKTKLSKNKIKNLTLKWEAWILIWISFLCRLIGFHSLADLVHSAYKMGVNSPQWNNLCQTHLNYWIL